MRRGGGARARRQSEPDKEAAAAAGIAWAELSEAERTALRRMNRGPYASVDEELGLRLIGLGLAVARSGGLGISRAGRELVINALLDARQGDAP